MRDTLEKALKYAIGGILGAIVSYGVINHLLPHSLDDNVCTAIIVLAVSLGVAIAVAFDRHQTLSRIRRNNEVRNETVALITHEMRTGLTSTGWAIQTVLTRYPDAISDDDKEMLNDVVQSIHTTVSHAVNLLDISLIDIGKLSISLEVSTLEEVEDFLKSVVEKYEIGAKQKDVKFTYEIDLDDKREIEIDQIRLRIVLESLIENALQYTVRDIKEIDVSVTNDKDNLFITVKDTGIGIPDREKENIFKEFYRAKNARQVLSSGSGIGLYTSAQYVKAHQGTITFDSKEGEGTTFHVTIPLKSRADVNDFLDKL